MLKVKKKKKKKKKKEFFSHVQTFSELYRHNAVPPETRERGTSQSEVQHSTIESLHSSPLYLESVCYLSGTGATTNTSVSHLEGDISRFQRMSSIDSFNQRSHPNEMLTLLFTIY